MYFDFNIKYQYILLIITITNVKSKVPKVPSLHWNTNHRDILFRAYHSSICSGSIRFHTDFRWRLFEYRKIWRRRWRRRNLPLLSNRTSHSNGRTRTSSHLFDSRFPNRSSRHHQWRMQYGFVLPRRTSTTTNEPRPKQSKQSRKRLDKVLNSYFFKSILFKLTLMTKFNFIYIYQYNIFILFSLFIIKQKILKKNRIKLPVIYFKKLII